MTPTTGHAQRYTWLPKLVVAMVGVAVLTVLFGLSMLEDRLIALSGRELQMTAAEVAEKVDMLLFERYGDIQVLAEAGGWLGSDGDRWTEHLHMLQHAYPLYAWMGVIENSGRVLAATDPGTVGLDLGSKDWFKDLAAEPTPRVHDVRRDELSKGRDAVGFSAPVRRNHPAQRTSASFHGAVATRVATSQLDALVTRTLREVAVKAGYSQGLEYQILTPQGRVVVESIPQQNGPVDLFSLGTVSAKLVFSEGTGFIEEEHRRRHVPVLTGYARMPARRELDALGWGVLVRMDRQAVVAPIRSALWAATMWGGILFTPMLGVFLWTTRQLRQEWHRAEIAKQAVTEAHDFLQSSLDALTSHIAILDERATIIGVNRAWRLFGDQNQCHDTDHGVGRNYLEICESCSGEGAEEAQHVAQGIRAILQGQQREWVGEYPCHGPGEQRWFLVRLSKFEMGEKLRVLVDHRNVTKSQLAFLALQESQATMQAIIRNALDAHILMDQEGAVVGWNPKAEEIFGWSPQEAVGRSLANVIIPPGYREAHGRGLKKFLAGGMGPVLDKRFEIEGWHKEGRPFPVELTIAAIKRPGGYLFSAFIRDVTERVHQERRQAAEHRIAELLLEAASLDAASQDIIGMICDTLGWRLGVLWKVDEDMQVLRCAAIGKEPQGCESFVERTRQINFVRGAGLPGRVWESGRVEWIPDVTQDGNFPRAPFALEAGLHAAFAFPIRLYGKVHAVMEFFAKGIRPPDRKLLDMFDGVAAELSQFLERKQAERNLSRSEARLSGILRLAQDAVVSVDESQRIILFNSGAEEIFGYAAEEVLGQPLDLLVPAQFRKTHSRMVCEFGSSSRKAERAMNRSEIFGLRKSGEEFPAEASIAKVTVEGVTIYTTILRDISKRKQQEQALRNAKATAEQAVSEKTALLATVEAFFIRIAETGAVCEWTSQAERLFGIPLTDAIGRTFQDLSIGWSWEAIVEAINRATQTLRSVHLDKVRLVIREDRQRFLKLTVSPLCKDSGIDVVLMGEDITDYLLLEHDLTQAQKLESIGQLAAGIAHEINTPTQFVGDNVRFLSDSFADLLVVLDRHRELLASAKAGTCPPELVAACEAESERADLGYLREEIPKAMAQSAEGIERITKIVRAMKDFAHPGSDEKTFVDLNKAIESTVTVTRNEWKYVADMKTDLAPDIPPVPCLLGRFNQVILNMIVNAAHAIGDVVKGTGSKGGISITSRRAGQFAEIRIADTGTGIPEEIRHKIFDPFFTTKEVGKGTGQGLAIARSVVVDKHRGSITVESEVGKGTTFIVRLPLTEPGETKDLESAA